MAREEGFWIVERSSSMTATACLVLSIARVLTPVVSRRADIDGVRGAQYENSGQILLASKICTRGEYFSKRRGVSPPLGGLVLGEEWALDICRSHRSMPPWPDACAMICCILI